MLVTQRLSCVGRGGRGLPQTSKSWCWRCTEGLKHFSPMHLQHCPGEPGGALFALCSAGGALTGSVPWFEHGICFLLLPRLKMCAVPIGRGFLFPCFPRLSPFRCYSSSKEAALFQCAFIFEVMKSCPKSRAFPGTGYLNN